jgi:5-methylcytosine-specific restriction enzyme B
MNSKNIDELLKKTSMTKEKLQEIINCIEIENKRQLIFSGPPGTGKTWVAKEIVDFLSNDGCSEIVQFHPSYGYEEFMVGLKPVADGNAIKFEPEEGIVLEIAKKAEKDKDNKYFLIIDEMNRGNLPKIFGELMFLFEYRNKEISLQYELKDGSNKFKLPENLFFIGTMNTADRSIRGIDAALRRRFDVFKFNPDVDILKGFYKSGNKNEYGNLFSSFEKLNNMLEDVLGSSDMLIGHSFFMEEVLTKDKLRYKWERQIKPQIEEYLYDNKTALSEFEFENIFN